MYLEGQWDSPDLEQGVRKAEIAGECALKFDKWPHVARCETGALESSSDCGSARLGLRTGLAGSCLLARGCARPVSALGRMA